MSSLINDSLLKNIIYGIYAKSAQLAKNQFSISINRRFSYNISFICVEASVLLLVY